MKIVNIGIVAHVDAGKTSLTERILYETHVIDEIGRVDQGNTQTDSMELEKRRGITIKASVVSFLVKDLKVNLIDTPGHADFIAEVERSFSVLDGAILVISAVEGVQAQTKILLHILQKLAIPTIIFINKIDRRGAQADILVEKIKERLTAYVLPLYRVENIGTKQAYIVANSFDSTLNQAFLEDCIELLSRHDESCLEAYINDTEITTTQVQQALLHSFQNTQIHPIFFGSAMTGMGVTELLTGVATMFPAHNSQEETPLSAVVFKLEKASSGEKIAYVRVFSGSIRVREYVDVRSKKDDNSIEIHTAKVKKLHIFCEGKTIQAQKVEASDFCKVWGLKDIKIGDVIGEWSEKIKDIHFVAPQMETRVEAKQAEKKHQLYRALTELSAEDPLVQILKDDFHQELYLRLFGIVQKEVIETILKENYGLDICFLETRIVYIEKPQALGEAFELIGTADNPFYATVGFKVEPGPPGSGVTYRLAVKLGSLPLPFHRAIEETVFTTLKQGLYGWEVTDIVVTLTHTGYAGPVTTAGDFRKLVPLVLMASLSHAGTDVYEPINQFELSVPIQTLSTTLFKLAAAKAQCEKPIFQHTTFLITGTVPVVTTESFRQGLHSFTEGEGILMTKPWGFHKLEPVFPLRKRIDANPLNRKDYLLHIMHTY